MTIYAPGKGKVLRTITDGLNNPFAVAFDGSGNVYIANLFGDKGAVTVYAPGGASLLRTISQGVYGPEALAFDSSSDLFVANCCSHKGKGAVTVTPRVLGRCCGRFPKA